jgi:hypothetical protein
MVNSNNRLRVNSGNECVSFSCTEWPELNLRGLVPELSIVGSEKLVGKLLSQTTSSICWQFPSTPILLVFKKYEIAGGGIRLDGFLSNESDKPIVLKRIYLLRGYRSAEQVSFFGDLDKLRIYQQTSYSGSVTWARTEKCMVRSGEAQGDSEESISSRDIGVIYNTATKKAFLAGFLSSNRWIGSIHYKADSKGDELWTIGMNLGKVVLKAGESLTLEPMVFLTGQEPWNLLEEYGSLVAEHYPVRVPDQSPVSYCSWYPYRLSVTQEDILANAKIASQRLKPYGLSTMQVDLGWEKNNLSSTITENERFSHGLRWLADRMEELGLRLGVWWAPFCISEFDPLVQEHPEFLVSDEQGNPFDSGIWFWEPKGKCYSLDLTHPGARQWLKDGIASLIDRGVRYLKTDFIGIALAEMNYHRHDSEIVFGGGCEAQRLGLGILAEALNAKEIDGWLLNCGGMDLPGLGSGDILYECQDTGNTGNTGWEFHKNNFIALACHLFKHRRWGIIQPSCLCVGLPGTITEARVRASITFLSGGEVDISDDLTTLPEDRWKVLLATVPPYGHAAKVIDLFDPLPDSSTEQEKEIMEKNCAEYGRVWHLPVKTTWDEWDVVGIFDYGTLANQNRVWSKMTQLTISFERLGLDAGSDYEVHEFWSGQSVHLPAGPSRVRSYSHLGDYRIPVSRLQNDVLNVNFHGPDVKLLIIRKSRSFPWPLATTFHQSGGCELDRVVWQSSSKVLSGILRRQDGETGTIFITCGCVLPIRVLHNGKPCMFKYSRNVLTFEIICSDEINEWSIEFE